MDFSLAAEILAEMLAYIVDDAKKHAPNRHFASGQDSGGCAIGLPHAEARLACRKGPVTAMLCSAELRSRLCEAKTVKRAKRASKAGASARTGLRTVCQPATVADVCEHIAVLIQSIPQGDRPTAIAPP